MKFALCFAALIAWILLTQSTAIADCAGPTIVSVKSDRAAPGETVTVKGSRFATCDDVGRPGHVPVRLPLTKITILLVQGKHTTPIGTVDADKDFKISVTVTIPENASLGPATIVAEFGPNQRTRPVDLAIKRARA